MAKFQVNILGCGSATPSARHQPSCQVVDFRDKLFMIDCGEGSQSQFRRLGLKFSRLGHIFISHLHGDHFFGLPGLLCTLSLHQVEGRLTLHMFREGIELLRPWMDYFNRQSSYEIVYEEIPHGFDGIIYEDSGLTVEAFPLSHRIACTGFLFREKPKLRHLRGDMIKFFNIPVAALQSIKEGADYVMADGTVIANERLTTPADPSMSYAYCSDTMYMPSLAERLRGVDVIYHEATYHSSLEATAVERGHSTAAQAARTALDAGAARLIIGHFSKRYVHGEQPLLEEASAIFPHTVLANEGLRIPLL